MDIASLNELVRSAAALRSRGALVPAGGPGDKLMPPTYDGGTYAMELRRIDGVETPCVLLDSVQSQANRFEAALQDALDGGRISIPCIRVSFPEDLARELGPITSLTAPHRCYDAILRDSTICGDGTPFPRSEVGKALAAARPADASALFRYCPTALVFGAWDSTGARGGMGAKFTRAVSSEIVGVGATPGVHTSSRIDPLGIRREVGVIVDGDDPASWRLAAEGERGAKRPSEVNHGNVLPSVEETRGGVTVDRIEQTWVLSLSALRRYRFPVDGGYNDERDVAARTALVALALAARALVREDGLFLRSRCQLVPAGEGAPLESVATDGTVQPMEDLHSEAAIALLYEAVASASARGLEWETNLLELEAEERLVDVVRRSFELAPKSGT